MLITRMLRLIRTIMLRFIRTIMLRPIRLKRNSGKHTSPTRRLLHVVEFMARLFRVSLCQWQLMQSHIEGQVLSLRSWSARAGEMVPSHWQQRVELPRRGIFFGAGFFFPAATGASRMARREDLDLDDNFLRKRGLG
jgi:hypothetical protein